MRLIDADALSMQIRRLTQPHEDFFLDWVYNRAIAEAPTVDAMPVRHGHWVLDEEQSSQHVEKIYNCSACHNYDAWGEMEKTNYCPNCGAKMDEVRG